MKSTSIQGLRTTIYKVNDINLAKEWYTRAFGVEPYFDEPFYVGYNIGGYELGLHPSDVQPDDKNESVLSYWGVENIEEVYEELIRLGATPNESPTNVGGDIVVASVKGPFGNILGIIYNPEFKIKD